MNRPTSANTHIHREWRVGQRLHHLGDRPWIMGIVNVTPDSFSDGGRFVAHDVAVEHALSLVSQGADLLDIGGESTRPGAQPVAVDEELRRVIPVIESLAKQVNIPISVDTMKSSVAKAALDAGATIVNDVSALSFDERMPDVCAASSCGIIAMHMQGTPQTMQDEPTYKNVVRDVANYLKTRVEALDSRGIDPRRIVLDPGIGFGKTADHNLAILSNIAEFRTSGRPVLIGHSRKRFLGRILGKPIDERTAGTIGVSIALASQHADILRVHDVAAVRDAITAWQAILSPDGQW